MTAIAQELRSDLPNKYSLSPDDATAGFQQRSAEIRGGFIFATALRRENPSAIIAVVEICVRWLVLAAG